VFAPHDSAVSLAVGPDDSFRTTAAARRPRVQPSRTLLSADLLRLTDAYAARVLDGEFDFLYPRGGQLPDGARWRVLLFGDGDVDVWLIGWPPGAATELHGHGESIAAVTVISGDLAEARLVAEESGAQRLEHRVLSAGDQASFPQGWVHSVGRATADGDGGAPAFSVHAYSPPLPEIEPHLDLSAHIVDQLLDSVAEGGQR
jgi:hypothetical protein